MGRITVSLSNELESRLDKYASDNDLAVSKVVSRALEVFFDGPPSDPGQPADLVATQRYLSLLVEQLDVVRQSLHQIAIAQQGPFAPLPEELVRPLVRPPWNKPRQVEAELE